MLKEAYELQHAKELRAKARQQEIETARWLREYDLNQEQARKINSLKKNGSNVVYYLRFRDTLKIGTSINVKARVSGHPWEELLAVEPGDYKVESRRHREFAEHRVSGEWFDLNDTTTRMVDEIREASIDWFEFVFHKCPPLPQLKRHVVWPDLEDYPSL